MKKLILFLLIVGCGDGFETPKVAPENSPPDDREELGDTPDDDVQAPSIRRDERISPFYLSWEPLSDGVLRGKTTGALATQGAVFETEMVGADWLFQLADPCINYLHYRITDVEVSDEDVVDVTHSGTNLSVVPVSDGDVTIIVSGELVDIVGFQNENEEANDCPAVESYPDRVEYRFEFSVFTISSSPFFAPDCESPVRFNEQTVVSLANRVPGKETILNWDGMPEFELKTSDGDPVYFDGVTRSNALAILGLEVGHYALETEFGDRFEFEVRPQSDTVDLALSARTQSKTPEDVERGAEVPIHTSLMFAVETGEFTTPHCSPNVQTRLEISTPEVCIPTDGPFNGGVQMIAVGACVIDVFVGDNGPFDTLTFQAIGTR